MNVPNRQIAEKRLAVVRHFVHLLVHAQIARALAGTHLGVVGWRRVGVVQRRCQHACARSPQRSRRRGRFDSHARQRVVPLRFGALLHTAKRDASGSCVRAM